ncbi:urea ABC transporter ATP-binding subunit UrtE [Calderihabitans maritimus]|uniref:Urea ABC transporter ATP-binding protein UrtE n=1 Tax=Calderihabitans maritimus TaxID=1246530 RepID=A0A1Z5HTY1_9FIRM|nr:urea ABC transporter ATP-binding subunit UrtE [Calderihabitans maritimus]GAW92791.1 urea ABC transporter ATP-binding protein UrtE [Calderihabitans maritimus]
MLKAEQLSVSYGESVVLNDVNLQVPSGAIVSLIGRNGVGKTTLLKAIMGLLRPKKGKITLGGADITTYPPDRRARCGIGYVPQGREIFPYLTVYENLCVGLSERDDLVLEEVLDLFPMLKSLLTRMGGNLSGGQQQQLAIARALVRRPRILLLDEPTEGIQPSVVTDIKRVIKTINKKKNVSILLVEQYLDFALGVADYFYVMENGRIVLQGVTRDVELEKLKEHLAV